jgi:hypothetical protein
MRSTNVTSGLYVISEATNWNLFTFDTPLFYMNIYLKAPLNILSHFWILLPLSKEYIFSKLLNTGSLSKLTLMLIKSKLFPFSLLPCFEIKKATRFYPLIAILFIYL